MVPAPIPPSSFPSSFPSLKIVAHEVTAAGPVVLAVVLVPVRAGVQVLPMAPLPPGSVWAWQSSLLAATTALSSSVVVLPISIFRVKVSFAVRSVVPAFITVPAVVLVSIIIVSGRGVFSTVSSWRGRLLKRMDCHLTRSLHNLRENE